jgi:hypothetical protein
LVNDECGLCRRLGRWLEVFSAVRPGKAGFVVQAIGGDPEALALLHPGLDIWDAYATVHLLMPDGSTLLGGEAVAEILREMPRTRWLARCFDLEIQGFKPFQGLLNWGYAIVSDLRPLLGCESCGSSNFWVKSISRVLTKLRMGGRAGRLGPASHFASRRSLKTELPAKAKSVPPEKRSAGPL